MIQLLICPSSDLTLWTSGEHVYAQRRKRCVGNIYHFYRRAWHHVEGNLTVYLIIMGSPDVHGYASEKIVSLDVH